MQICCTKKLLESISVTPEEHFNIDPLFSWHADVFTIDRRKTVVLVNDKNRYAVILYDLRAKDFKNFGSIFVELGLYSKRPEWTQPENLDALFIGISEIVDNSKPEIV